MNSAVELNIDGLPGPTHHYAGLSWGNLASMRNKNRKSNPRQAALQSLDKMRRLMELGIPQAIMPPHERPWLPLLRQLGYSGSDKAIITHAARSNPTLLACCYTSAAMWAANAATVSPSADTRDGKVHISPANLLTELHRAIESELTTRLLRKLFADPAYFVVHDPLPGAWALRDEGAANHLRLAPMHGRPGLEIFTFDSAAPYRNEEHLHLFPARQSLGASLGIKHRHGVEDRQAIAIERSPLCIDAGAFHNDLVVISNLDVLIYHQQAFDQREIMTIQSSYHRLTGQDPRMVEMPADEFSLPDAARSYLFNSQLVTLPDGQFVLIAPQQCCDDAAARACIDLLTARGIIFRSEFVDVGQSMLNGGGPACLRLRVVLTPKELSAMHQGVLLTPALFRRLVKWVHRHYRQNLSPRDLADPSLMFESRRALDELTKILKLGPIYDFQR
jgi:succinylarginine dihydrolase